MTKAINRRNSTLIRPLFNTILLLAATVLFSATISAQTVHRDAWDGKVYFKIKDGVFLYLPESEGEVNPSDAWFLKEILSSHQVSALVKPFYKTSSFILQRTFRLEFSDINNANQIIEKLLATGVVEYAERVPIDNLDYTPNDPSYPGSMWNLTKISAANAWNYSKGDPNIVVAVVDGAVSTTHPDLTGNLWVNPGETAGNGVDDDGDGYIDNVNGWDAADSDNNPNPGVTSVNHGTHCAGIVAATTDNGTGIASIGFGISYMAVKCAAGDGSGSFSAGYQGITYAADAGADVITCSWGSYTFSQTNQNSINYAYGKGAVIFATAGNDNQDKMRYPGAYTNVICVASTASDDKKSSFSNFGTWVDISSPGSNIYSTVPSTTYTNMSGTSMACPLVAGMAGLMLSLNPNLTQAQVENCIKSSAVNIDAVNGTYVGKLGAGRINAEEAMKCVQATISAPPVADFTSDVINTCDGTVKFTDKSTNIPTTWLWDFGDGKTSTLQHPSHTYANNGSYTVKLTATNANGNDAETKTSFLTVNRPSAPTATGGKRCGPGIVSLAVAPSGGGIINWYSVTAGGTSLATGGSYAPNLSVTTTFYAEEEIQKPVQKTGPVNNTFAAGGYLAASRGLIFDVLAPMTLKTVKVYANTAGNRTIEIFDAPGGTVLKTKTVSLPAGESRVTLDFVLAPGTGYFITATGTLIDLYRNNTGATAYPYTVSGLVSIKTTDASTNPNDYYYYFYDWEVQGQSCFSSRVPVTGTINQNPAVPTVAQNGNDLIASPAGFTYQWYLNGNIINGATGKTYTPVQSGNFSVEITDANGCIAVSVPFNFIYTALPDLKNIFGVHLSPNPVRNDLLLSVRNSFASVIGMELYSPIGTLIAYYSSGTEKAEYVQELSFAGLPAGIYFLKITAGEEVRIERIVKQ